MSDELKEKTEGQSIDKFSLAKSAVERAILRQQAREKEQKAKPKQTQEKPKEIKAKDEKPTFVAPKETKKEENPVEVKETKAEPVESTEASPTDAPVEETPKKKENKKPLGEKIKSLGSSLKKKFQKKKDEAPSTTETKEAAPLETKEETPTNAPAIEKAKEEKKPSKFEEQLKKFRENISIKIQKSKEIHKTLIHYNTINKPFVEVYYYVNNELIKHNKLELMEYEIDGLVPSGYNRIASFITENSDDYSNFELIVSNDRVFKTTNAYPKMNKFKMLQLYSQEINQSVPGYKDKYSTSISAYNGEQSSIYYTYFIPIEILNYFNKIAKSIKSRCTGVELYSHYIFKSVSEHIKDDFVLHYANDVFSTVILSYNGVFTTYYNALNDEQEIRTKYVSFISKHLLELEKKDTNNFYSNNKELVPFMGDDVKDIEIDFTKYHFNGVKL